MSSPDGATSRFGFRYTSETRRCTSFNLFRRSIQGKTFVRVDGKFVGEVLLGLGKIELVNQEKFSATA
jgi:hypothetical protein